MGAPSSHRCSLGDHVPDIGGGTIPHHAIGFRLSFASYHGTKSWRLTDAPMVHYVYGVYAHSNPASLKVGQDCGNRAMLLAAPR